MSDSGAPVRNVICMKWGSKYGPEYVNRLYAMVRRHLTGDFRMVCLTDDSHGIRAEVACFPIPALELPPGIPERGWTKLATFSADLHGLRGTALFLDLDVVIVGPLDGFFTQPGEFVIIHDYKRPGASPATLRSTATSSVPTPTCWNTSEPISNKYARTSATNRPIYRISCTEKDCSATGLLPGVRASSTTASRAGPATTGSPRSCRTMRGS